MSQRGLWKFGACELIRRASCTAGVFALLLGAASCGGGDSSKAGTKPQAVGDFTATAGDDGIALSWTDSAEIDGVMIRRAAVATPTTPEEGSLVADLSAPTGGSFVDDTVSIPGDYFYAAFAYRGEPVLFSDLASAKATWAPAVSPDPTVEPTPDPTEVPTPDPTPDPTPEPPSALADLAAQSVGEGVQLSWTAPAVPEGLEIHLRRSGGAAPESPEDGDEVATLTDATTTSMLDSSVVDGESYHYAAFVRDAGGLVSAATTLVHTHHLPPVPVTELSAETTDTSVTLSWLAAPGMAGVVLRRSTTEAPTSPDAGDALADIADNSTTQFVDETVEDGVTYFYAAFAHNAGQQAFSEAASVEHAMHIAPQPVSDLTAAADGAAITLSWTNAERMAGLVINRRTDAAPEHAEDGDTIASIEGGDTTSYVDSDLVDGQRYFYAVFAHNAGRQAFAEAVTADATHHLTPVPVTDFVAQTAGTGVVLSWTAAPGMAGVVVRRSATEIPAGPTEGEALADLNDPATTSVPDANVEDGETYFYAAFAHNAGQQAFAAGAGAEHTVHVLPQPVSDFSALDNGEAISLSWTNPQRMAGVIINRRTDRAPENDEDGDTIASFEGRETESFRDEDLVDGQRYYYAVFTHNVGQHDWSAPTLADTTHHLTPVPVTGLVAERVEADIQLSWTPAAGMAGVVLLRSTEDFPTQPDEGNTIATIDDNGTHMYLDTGVQDGSTYYYTALAFNAGQQAFAAVANVSFTLHVPPGEVTDLQIADDGAALTLTWTNPAHMDGAYIQRRPDRAPEHAEDGVRIAVRGPQHTSFTDANIADGQQYYYALITHNVGAESFSDPVVVEITHHRTPVAAGAISAEVTQGSFITVSWTHPSTMAGVRIRRSIDTPPTGPEDGTLIADVPAGMPTQWIDRDVLDGTVYAYAAFAYNVGQHGFSDADTTTVTFDALEPTTPSAMLVYPSGGTMRVDWRDPPRGAEVLVRRGVDDPPVDADSGDVVADLLIPTAGSVFDDGVSVGTEYGYSLFARNQVGTSTRITANAIMAAPGDFDPNFGEDLNGDGVLDGRYNVGAGVRSVFIEDRGHIVFSGGLGGGLFVRKNALGGVPDAGFGTDGIAELLIPADIIDGENLVTRSPRQIVRDAPRQRYIVAGHVELESGLDGVFVAAVTEAGAVDTSFGGDYDGDSTPDGYEVFFPPEDADFDEWRQTVVVMVQDSGRIVVGGRAREGGNNRQLAVWGFTVDGAIDTTYGTDFEGDGTPDGYSVFGTNGEDSNVEGAAVDDAGNLYIAHYAWGRFGVHRIRPDGLVDRGYGVNGVAWEIVRCGTTQSRAMDVTIDAQGRAVVVGGMVGTEDDNFRYRYGVARYLPNGTLDPSFGDGTHVGFVCLERQETTNIAHEDFRHVHVDDEGRITASGSQLVGPGEVNIVSFRFDDSGAIDPSYGVNGKVTIDEESIDRLYRAWPDAQGRLRMMVNDQTYRLAR